MTQVSQQISQLNTHEYFMQKAMLQANLAEQLNEVPVGAVVVLNNEIIGLGHNQCISRQDPSLHAEVVAIRQAAQHIQNYRLTKATVYVTLEPCSMCAGLMVHSRIAHLVFGASDPKTGAAGSVMNLVQHASLNHIIDVTSGVLSEQCAQQLSAFFKRRRAEIKQLKKAQQRELPSN